MKKFLIMALAICALLGYSIVITKEYHNEKEKSKVLETTIDGLNEEVTYQEIRLHDSISVYSAQVQQLNMTVQNIETYYGDLLKANKIKPKEVNSLTDVETAVQDVVYVPVVQDTFGGLKTSYMDDFVSIKVDIDTMRYASIDYLVKDSLTIINYQKKHSILFGLFKWNENTKTVVLSANPKMQITNVKSINNFEKK